MERYRTRLQAAEPDFRELIRRVPLQSTPPLPSEWLRCEMLERHEVLRHAPVAAGATVLEVGSGPHAISTVPLAYAVGRTGRVVAVERARWGSFRQIVAASGMGDRVWPVACDARQLPLRDDTADLAVCLHGVRSLRGRSGAERVILEMLRVAPRALLAESLPIARSDAERAHLAMYDLREPVLSATTGARDDLPYVPLEQLASLVEAAGGVVKSTGTLEVALPHFLAYFPRALAEEIPAGDLREDLLRRWDAADAMRRQFGEDHPPVGIVTAKRS
jgi:hypothetical protein